MSRVTPPADGRTPRTTDYVAGFAFDEHESKVALILKTRPDWQRGRLNGIGGHIEAGETPLAAMEREFEEETGGSAAWTHFATLRGDRFGVWFFRGVTSDPLESLTDEEVVWVSPDDLPSNVLPNLRWLIPMARSQQSRDWPFTIAERAVNGPPVSHRAAIQTLRQSLNNYDQSDSSAQEIAVPRWALATLIFPFPTNIPAERT